MNPPEHYYGDIVRRLFVAAGVLILIGVPIFSEYVPRPFVTSIFAVVIFALVAGFSNPDYFVVALINLVIAVLAVIFFEAYTIYSYLLIGSYAEPFILASQVLTIIFFIALYFSAKTVRGLWPRRWQGV